MKLNLIHIINPVKKGPESDLYTAQPITFESLKVAKAFAQQEVTVRLVAAHFSEDREIAPDGFTKTEDLIRSVVDITSFSVRRKLPLIKDILDRAYGYSDEDDEIIVYSNVDIAVLPHFYLFIKKQIESGLEAFVINRRTISDRYKRKEELPFMYSEIGEKHPGFDCFVFKRELYCNFKLDKICLGANWIGRALLVNLQTFAKNFTIFKNEHLTFHIGDDRSWKNPNFKDYDEFNKRELVNICLSLREKNPHLNGFYQSILNDIGFNIEAVKKAGELKRQSPNYVFVLFGLLRRLKYLAKGKTSTNG